jgi:hypothetical protein
MANLTNVVTKKIDNALGIFNKALVQLNGVKSLINSRATEIDYKIDELKEEGEFLSGEKVRVDKAIEKITEITGI